MKYLALIIMLFALYLLYRIAYTKQSAAQKSDAIPDKGNKNVRSVMGKSRFVLPDRSQPLQTTATQLDSEKREDKPPTFASETENEPDPDELTLL